MHILKSKWKIVKRYLAKFFPVQSEGKKSVRQVAFQLHGEKLVEGYGEVTADGTKFIDISKIRFNSIMPLTKTNCN